MSGLAPTTIVLNVVTIFAYGPGGDIGEMISRLHSDEPFAPCILVNFHLADLETVRIVAKAIELKLTYSCCFRFGGAAVDPNKLVVGIVLIETIFDWSAVPE